MGAGEKISLGVGRLLELGRRGVWCEGQSRGRAIYFFLFGQEAELTAWLLPSRVQLKEVAGEITQAPFFVIVTDQLSIARLAEERGHFAVHFNIALLRERMATLWLKNYLRVQFAQFAPEVVFFSPYFFPRLPRPRHLGIALAAMLHRFARDPLPHLLLNELETDFKIALIGFYELWKAGKHKAPAQVAYFGESAYLNVSSLFADKDYLQVRPLGWRIPQTAQAKLCDRLIYLWLNNPLVAREVRHTIFSLSQPCGPAPEIISVDPQVMTLSGMLHEIARRPGLVVADSSAPLLPLLNMNVPVALLRNPSLSSQMGLVKFSFFAGQERWPVLAGSGDLEPILKVRRLSDWWSEWAGRRTVLERVSSSDCRGQFIEAIYMPLLSRS